MAGLSLPCSAEGFLRLVRPLHSGEAKLEEGDVRQILAAVSHDRFVVPQRPETTLNDIFIVLQTLLSAPDKQEAQLLANRDYEEVISESPPYLTLEDRFSSYCNVSENLHLEALKFLKIYSVLELIDPNENPPYDGAALALADFYIARFMLSRDRTYEAKSAEQSLYAVVIRHPEDVERMRKIIDLMVSPRFTARLVRRLVLQGFIAEKTQIDEFVGAGFGATLGALAALNLHSTPQQGVVIGAIATLVGYMAGLLSGSFHTTDEGGQWAVIRSANQVLRRHFLTETCTSMLTRTQSRALFNHPSF